MKSCLVSLSLLVSVLVLILAAVAASTNPESQFNDNASSGQKLQQARVLFDFELYKRIYNKHYSSITEELNRKRLVFSRILRALVSRIKYKFRQCDYFKSVNPLSDRSPAESSRRRNKGRADLKQWEAANRAELSELLPQEGEDVEAEVRKLTTETHALEPAIQVLHEALDVPPTSAEKRSSKKWASKLRARKLPPLFSTGAGTPKSPKLMKRVASNNPDYEPPELPSFGLMDQHEDIQYWTLSDTIHKRRLSEQLYASLVGLDPESVKISAHKSDKMWVDHRQSGCLTTPRTQGDCGACYAFGSITVFEWIYCKLTGDLVEFSEQYMIDCGKGRYGEGGRDLDGCVSGTFKGAVNFAHNFGFELLANYPYAGVEQECPYAEDCDLKMTGYIRMKLDQITSVPVARWEEVIKYQPMTVSVKSAPDMEDWGGGIDDGGRCNEGYDHAMVIVGHGREDGKEFWLIRNSWGENWGLYGYWKLAKLATKKCLDEKAQAYGTNNARALQSSAWFTVKTSPLSSDYENSAGEGSDDGGGGPDYGGSWSGGGSVSRRSTKKKGLFKGLFGN